MILFGAKKRLYKMIEDSFGKDPKECFLGYNAENRLDKVKRYHNCIDKTDNTEWDIDNTTWDDLEMDQVFLRINHTNSFIGEQVLFHKMHILNLGLDRKKLDETEKHVKYFEDNPAFRTQVEERLQHIGKLDAGYYLAEFLMNSECFKIGGNLFFHVLQFLLVAFFVLAIIFDNILFLGGVVAVALVNLFIYLSIKQKYEVYFYSLIEFKKIYDFSKWMIKNDKSDLFVSDSQKEIVNKFKKLSFVLAGMNGRRQGTITGDVVALLNEYIWGILLIDVSMFNSIMEVIADKQSEVLELLEFVGCVDAEIAISSYRKSVAKWCIPEFGNDQLEFKSLAHPLLRSPITNDFALSDRVILTGANASGKSTFMKSVAINVILAQSINTCTAEFINMKPLQVVTCMALRDDILSGESYYYREAKYLKRMLDLVQEDNRVLVVIDEILKGTNTKERIAASKAILEYVAETDCMVIVATHDDELTQSKLYKNYHFCNKIENNDITFDYKLHEGRNTQSNAIELLAHLGYPAQIVEMARKNQMDN